MLDYFKNKKLERDKEGYGEVEKNPNYNSSSSMQEAVDAVKLSSLEEPRQQMFHGTSKKAAESIKRTGFDLSKAGSGVDRRLADKLLQKIGFARKKEGWYGEGIYVTRKKSSADLYATLVEMHTDKKAIIEVEVTGRIFDATDKGRVSQELRQFYGRDIAPTDYIKTVNDMAKQRDFVGVEFAPNEIVIWDSKSVKINSSKNLEHRAITTLIASLLSILFGLFFLSPNITGAAVGTLAQNGSDVWGTIMFFLGLFGLFISLRA